MFMSLGKILFRKKLLLNIIVIIQLGIALIISNVLIGSYNKVYQAYDQTYHYSDDTVFFAPMKINGAAVINVDFEYLELNNIDFEYLPKEFDGSRANVLCYGENTFNGLNKQLKSGTWPSSLLSNGKIECVTLNKMLSIGDTFVEQIGEETFSFIVVGKMDNNPLVLSSSRSSHLMQADMLFYDYSINRSSKAIICCNASIAEAIGTYGNALLFFNNVEDNIKNVAIENLRNTGNVIKMETIRQNSDDELSQIIKSFLPLVVCFSLMGMIAIVGMSLLNILKNKDVFSVYFICGMNKKEEFLLNLGYMMWMVLGVAIVTLILFIACNIFGVIDKLSYLSGFNQLVFSMIYLLLVTLFAAGSSLIFLNHANISEF